MAPKVLMRRCLYFQATVLQAAKYDKNYQSRTDCYRSNTRISLTTRHNVYLREREVNIPPTSLRSLVRVCPLHRLYSDQGNAISRRFKNPKTITSPKTSTIFIISANAATGIKRTYISLTDFSATSRDVCNVYFSYYIIAFFLSYSDSSIRKLYKHVTTHTNILTKII